MGLGHHGPHGGPSARTRAIPSPADRGAPVGRHLYVIVFAGTPLACMVSIKAMARCHCPPRDRAQWGGVQGSGGGACAHAAARARGWVAGRVHGVSPSMSAGHTVIAGPPYTSECHLTSAFQSNKKEIRMSAFTRIWCLWEWG